MSEVEEQEISQIIETGLSSILSGTATIEDVLIEYPDKVDVLRPELEIAMWLASRSEQVKPRPGYMQASRKRVLERIKQEALNQAQTKATKRSLFGFPWPRRLVFQAVAALMILLVLIMGTNGIVYASQSSIPGDQMYSVKRFSEQVEYQASFDTGKRVELSTRNAGRRLDEASALITKGRTAEVAHVLVEYQDTVNQALVQLEQVGDRQVARKSALAAALQTNLSRQNAQLEAMLAVAPSLLKPDLEQAHTTASSSLTVAVDVYNKMETIKSEQSGTPRIPTVVPSDTSIPPATETPVMTFTPYPTPTITLYSTQSPASNGSSVVTRTPTPAPDPDGGGGKPTRKPTKERPDNSPKKPTDAGGGKPPDTGGPPSNVTDEPKPDKSDKTR